MKLLEKVSKNPLERRGLSSEFLTTSGTTLCLLGVSLFCEATYFAIALSFISCGYVIGRTLPKVHRESLKYSGLLTSEIRVHGVCQAGIIASCFFGCDKSVAAVLLGLNQFVFSVCRGVVKKKEPTGKMTVYSV